MEKIIQHVRSAAEAKDIDPDIVESTYRAMISGFTELEMRVHKNNSCRASRCYRFSSTGTPDWKSRPSASLKPVIT